MEAANQLGGSPLLFLNSLKEQPLDTRKPAVIGVGATGAALAAAVLKVIPEALLVVTRKESRETLLTEGICVTGALDFRITPKNVAVSIEELGSYEPDLVYICTKTFHLKNVVEKLALLPKQNFAAVSCHNGLGTEDLLAGALGPDRALRMTLNYGAASSVTGKAACAFFNSPNYLGALTPRGAEAAGMAADLLTRGGLATEQVEDIRSYVWRKMVMKCSMANICAVTDMTIRDALRFKPTREIAFGCFGEAVAVAKAQGFDLGEGYVEKAVAYIEEVGVHKDSMCHDLAAGRPTEIDFLGAKIIEYAKAAGIPVPYYSVMTNLVRALEKKPVAHP